MKKILIGISAIVVVVVLAVVFFLGNIDKIVKGALEGVGSELLGEPVKVASVKIELKSGSGQITGLTIANPTGYSAPNAFQMDMIRLGLNLGSLGKQPIVVDELKVVNPVVQLEMKEDGSSNLKTLQDNIDKNRVKADKKAVKQTSSDATQKGDPVRISIGKLSMTGVTVHVNAPGQEPQTVVIPDIVEDNVGNESGLTPGEIGKLIVGRIISSSLENTIKKSLLKKAGEATKGFFDGLK
ncbi:MAG: hypothetical protein JRF05_05950 [Deltaproteobacteria bacterium]|jgi:hypothetical protein|nr:hypothetical protein [Deltaproteobacteria bacterium]